MKNIEVLKEVITVAALLIKFDCEDILEKGIFWEFIGELGIKIKGNIPVNRYYVKRILDELTQEEKEDVLQEFNLGFEGIYRTQSMYMNR